MILVDSNIPMYLVGTPGSYKTDAQRLLERLISQRERLVTDAEVLHARLSARDAIHMAVMEKHGISRILTFDSGFDGLPGIVRLY